MDPTIDQIVRWASQFENASAQIQKAYDWRISQWSTLGNAVLTAIFAIISSTLLEYYKKTTMQPHWYVWVGANVALYVSAYVFCRLEIDRLRREFLVLYTLLLP